MPLKGTSPFEQVKVHVREEVSVQVAQFVIAVEH